MQVSLKSLPIVFSLRLADTNKTPTFFAKLDNQTDIPPQNYDCQLIQEKK